tara:strand:- start:736 stop:1422 length:687 start_codon:yes stop_codon:yes gene_type:complete
MDLHNRKERSDMILEPLQVMTQLAILSYSPIGTKVSVSDNILQLHKPHLFQGVYRWYNSDGKDDLYYLFHAIRRYYKWYKKELVSDDDDDNDDNSDFEQEADDENNKIMIFNYILKCGISGLDKLIQTYSATEQTTITHTLMLYKNILSMETPDVFKNASEDSVSIDTVFQNIKTVYSDNMLELLYNGLVILDKCDEIYKPYYIDGLLKIVTPTNDQIRKWIREKLTC